MELLLTSPSECPLQEKKNQKPTPMYQTNGSFNDWFLFFLPALQARRLFDVFHEPFLKVPH